MRRGTVKQRFNDWIGDKIAYGLSTMTCFYVILVLCLVPLLFQQPRGTVAWAQYIIQSIFQGVALPVLGYVARMAGEKQDKLLNETHDTVMEELAVVKEELKLAREERQALKMVIHALHDKLD